MPNEKATIVFLIVGLIKKKHSIMSKYFPKLKPIGIM